MKKTTQIYGIRAVIEAIRSEKPLDRVFIQKGLQGNLIKELEGLLKKNRIPFSSVPPEKLNRMSSNNHQGVVATISPVQFQSLETLVESIMEKKTDPLFLLLDQLSDVRNFGAIIRTAECAGVDGIIIPAKGSAPVTGDTVKTSAGAVFQIPLAKAEHIKDAIYFLHASGIKTVAASEKSDHSLYEVDLSGPLAIIMGAEDKGISKSVLPLLQETAKIPLLGKISSLNVSVACGVMLYEAVRQRTIGSWQ